MEEIKNRVWISCPTSTRDFFVLQIYSTNLEQVMKFDEMCISFFYESWRWRRHDAFLPAGFCGISSEWHFVDVFGWRTPGVQDELLAFAQDAAVELDLPFEIE